MSEPSALAPGSEQAIISPTQPYPMASEADEKRRRLSGKQLPPCNTALTAPKTSFLERTVAQRLFHKQLSTAAELLEEPACSREEWPSEDTWKGTKKSDRSKYLWNLVSSVWCKQQADRLRAKGHKKQSAETARTEWRALGLPLRQALLRIFMERSNRPSYMVCDDGSAPTGYSHTLMENIRAPSMMLTWNNESWRLPPAASKGSLEKGVQVAQKVWWVKQLWLDLENFMAELRAAWPRLIGAWAMEISPQTLCAGSGALLHLHAVLKYDTGRAPMPSLQRLKFRGGLPHRVLGQSRSGRSTKNQDLYYVQAGKMGSVYSNGSKQPFHDYAVQVNWVLALVQNQKMTIAKARAEALRCVSGASRALKELDLVEQHQNWQAVQQAQDHALQQLRGQRKPWRTLPQVSAWAEQYESVADRYTFLVLEGPSRVGKSAFARALCPPGKSVYEVNAAAGTDLDFRGFLYGRDGLVLVDEVVPAQVVKERKLFQASPSVVQLGCSATNMHSYNVFLHGVRIVLCSNEWSSSLRDVTAESRDWLAKNCVHVKCDQELWIK